MSPTLEQHCKFKQRPRILAILLFLTGVGMLALLFATTRGPGVTPDAVTYLDLARNILAGRGFVARFGSAATETPVIHFPPLFSTLLALLGLLGIDPLQGARWLNLLLFGANILLVGFVLRRYTNNSLYSSALGSFFMLSSSAMIENHSAAWSEPLFLFFGTGGLFSIAMYLETDRKRLLVCGSFAIALAFLSRYVGGALVATAIVGIFLLGKPGYYRKFADAILLGMISVSPIALWTLRNLSLTGNATGRALHAQPVVRGGYIWTLVKTMSSWLVPGSERIVFLPAQYLLTSAILFLTPPPWFDNRLLSPVYVSGLILVLSLTHALFKASARSSVRVVLSIIGIVMAGIYATTGTVAYIYLHEYGRGLTGKEWQFESIAAQLRALDPDTLIYSNYPPAVYFYTGRASRSLPPLGDARPREKAEMLRRLEEGRAVVVYFHNARRFPLRTSATVQQDLPTDRQLQNLLRLVSLSLVEREGITSLYRSTKPAQDSTS